jgi:hypothetical protein
VSAPATIQELATEIVETFRRHERNCRYSAGKGAACVELAECREELADLVVEQIRKVNRK